MFIRAIFAIAIMMFIVCGASAATAWFPHEDHFNPRAELDAYARATGLRLLAANGPNSLRIWSANVMTGDLWGNVASRDVTLECRTSYDWGTRVTSVKSGRCTVTTPKTNSAEAMKLLSDLAKLDGKEIDCGVQDGESVLVEGVVNGQIFAFYSGNPGSCPDAASALVVKVRKLVIPTHRHGS
jgi:hypothetical protein